MKPLLLQLPLQSHDFFFSRENIPLASAYLLAISGQRDVDAELLPASLMSYGNDEAILQCIIDARPDLVGLSCYRWNIERSLFLSAQIKKHLPSCTVVMGGPEISAENRFLLRQREFHIGVVGEGEEVWNQLLQSFPNIPSLPGLMIQGEDRKWRECTPSLHPSDPKNLPSPYLAGLLDSHLDGVLWLETVRGCAYHCAYCYYHKQSRGLRTFPLERIFREVERAWNQGLEEIVFLDPCFTKRPNLEAMLEGLAVRNLDRPLRFFAEGNAEDITQDMAEKMARAGFVRIEVGLQSVNRATLRNINRTFDAERFLQGVRFLQKCGIDAMVDLIAGLPGDRLSDICNSLDWVIDREAYDDLMLYPLSLIAGTELHQRASEFGLCAMTDPPYLITRSPTLTARGMKQAFHYYEASIEEEVSPLEVPPLLDESSNRLALPAGLCYRVDWSRPEETRIPSGSEGPVAYALTVSMTREILREPGLWRAVLRDYLDKNPFSLLSIEVPPDIFPEELDPLWKLACSHSHPVDRDYTVTHSPYRSFMVLSRLKGLLYKWPDLREFSPLVLPDGQEVSFPPVCKVMVPGDEIPGWFIDHIHQRYLLPPEIKPWKPPEP